MRVAAAEQGPTSGLVDWVWEPGATGLARRRRQLQMALGLIWMLDAGLQLQPYMFGHGLVTSFLEGSQVGNPQVVKAPVNWLAHVVAHDPALFNAGLVVIQLVIAVGILNRRSVKQALALSIVWSLAVWWFGEGMGGVFAGQTPVMGYPGAVLLYGLIALLVWPTDRVSDSVAASGALGPSTPRVLWLILWASFVRYLLLSFNRSPQGLRIALAAMAPGEPGWEKSIDNGLARALANHGTEVSIVLAVLSALVAIAVFSPRMIRAGLVVAGVSALVYWVAQDFGGMFTSQGTDPNSGPLLVLLAATFWPLVGRRATPTPARDWEPALPVRRTW